ncbi:hypothetical protein [Brevundimonas aurantiaca]|jgi:hypothetical protein|uniref:hypothetical protein n=1 Tax=Brevundimonas aurantiaca TaxID=74316 RepID=UPI001D187109|nr:hypothetical protein [Brevundimonas aurantiaca]MCC4293519.1 hypothetical protein [Brevundimonas aurantiaca]
MSRYLKPGTLVRRTDLSGNSSEDGVVIHCWLDDALGFFDCYVAFFGSAVPEGRPPKKPYVLRYSSTSLEEIKPALIESGGYELVMGSDVADRDGMYLELNDGSMETMPLGEVFYSDIDGSMTATTYGNDLPLDAVEWMIAEAKRRLPPRR